MNHTIAPESFQAENTPDTLTKQRIRDAEDELKNACSDLAAALHRAELTETDMFPPPGDGAGPTERILFRVWQAQWHHRNAIDNQVRRLETALRAVQRADAHSGTPAEIAARALFGRDGAKRRNALELSAAEQAIVAQYRAMDAKGRQTLRAVAESLAETSTDSGGR